LNFHLFIILIGWRYCSHEDQCAWSSRDRTYTGRNESWYPLQE
jgi:hypothetical protein